MREKDPDRIRKIVRERYGKITAGVGSCCADTSCCASPSSRGAASAGLGYSGDELSVVPEGADMGLGCGNPQAIAALKAGETVLDLGCGGGLDCFLAARRVGATGHVIGVDMTPEMIATARANVRKGGYGNVEFRLGEIEHLPLADNSVDVIISNCVINLSPAKGQVFRDAYRVLRNNGRLAVSDVVAIAPLPEKILLNADAYCGCVAGAAQVEAIKVMLHEAGFSNICIEVQQDSARFIREWFPGSGAEEYVRSAIITARKKIRS